MSLGDGSSEPIRISHAGENKAGKGKINAPKKQQHPVKSPNLSKCGCSLSSTSTSRWSVTLISPEYFFCMSYMLAALLWLSLAVIANAKWALWQRDTPAEFLWTWESRCVLVNCMHSVYYTLSLVKIYSVFCFVFCKKGENKYLSFQSKNIYVATLICLMGGDQILNLKTRTPGLKNIEPLFPKRL